MINISDKFSLPRNTGQYIVAGTDSFRLSCRMFLSSKLDTPFNNFGGNMQNIEKGMRIIYKSDPGYTFLQCDQSGAEALIVAYLCRSAKYRSLFIHGVKPHVYMALKLFPHIWAKHVGQDNIARALVTPIPELRNLTFWKELEKLIKSSDNWSASERYYHIAKKVIHASSYGMKGNTFRMSILKESGGVIVISLKEAEQYLKTFFIEFPEIAEWHSRVFMAAKGQGVLRNLFGFPYYITDYVNQNDYKDLIAWIPQSTVACITRQAYVRLQEYIEENKRDWHLLADTHDSYMQEVPDAEYKEAAMTMKSFIEIEMVSPVDGVKFRMKSEVQFGKNWSPRKEKGAEIINQEGLQEV